MKVSAGRGVLREALNHRKNMSLRPHKGNGAAGIPGGVRVRKRDSGVLWAEHTQKSGCWQSRREILKRRSVA